MINRRRKAKMRNPKKLVVAACVVLLCVSAALIIFALKSNDTPSTPNGGDEPDITGAGAIGTNEPTPEPPQPEPLTPKPDMPSSSVVYDTVIKNARIINPETNSDISGMNIGITDGKITALSMESLNGNEEYDVSGYIVAPGFIDIDSYDPTIFGEKYKISDGVTTNLLMHGGSANAKSFYNNFNSRSYMVNYGTSNLMTTVRGNVGYGGTSVITNRNDIQKLVDIVEQNIKDGALGISMSPEYAPGIQGDEMVAMCELAAKYNLTTYYHLRYSNPDGEKNSIAAIREVIDLAKKTGVSIHILHITSTGATYCAEEAFRIVDEARKSGIDITADIYPYDSWATYAGSQRFSQGWQQRFNLTYSDLQFANTNEFLTEATFAQAQKTNRLVIANGSIPEHEIRYALATPYVFIASDTILGEGGADSHHRGAGSYSRTIGKYCREEGVITLIDAIAKVSYLPAKRLESASFDMMAKGRIEIGADADLAIFDFNTIIDTATAANVASHSEGMKYVLVAGKLVYDNTAGDNRFTGEKPGRPIYSYLKSPDTRPQLSDYTVTVNGQELKVKAVSLFDRYFIDVKELASVTGSECAIYEDGTINACGAKFYIGKPDIIANGKYEWLSYEPIIYRGSVYIPAPDVKFFK